MCTPPLTSGIPEGLSQQVSMAAFLHLECAAAEAGRSDYIVVQVRNKPSDIRMNKYKPFYDSAGECQGLFETQTATPIPLCVSEG